jgi:hypothetical protein
MKKKLINLGDKILIQSNIPTRNGLEGIVTVLSSNGSCISHLDVTKGNGTFRIGAQSVSFYESDAIVISKASNTQNYSTNSKIALTILSLDSF